MTTTYYNNFSSANSSCSTWSLYIFVPFLPPLGLLAVTMSCFYSTLYIHSINMNVWLSLRWNCMNCMRWLWTRFHRQLSRRIFRSFFCSSGPSWTYSSDLPHLYTSLFSQPPLVVFSGLIFTGVVFLPVTCTSSTAQGGGGSFKNRKPIGEIDCCESRMAERIHWLTERWLELCLLEWLQWLQWSPHPQLLDVVWCTATVVVVVA